MSIPLHPAERFSVPNAPSEHCVVVYAQLCVQLPSAASQVADAQRFAPDAQETSKTPHCRSRALMRFRWRVSAARRHAALCPSLDPVQHPVRRACAPCRTRCRAPAVADQHPSDVLWTNRWQSPASQNGRRVCPRECAPSPHERIHRPGCSVPCPARGRGGHVPGFVSRAYDGPPGLNTAQTLANYRGIGYRSAPEGVVSALLLRVSFVTGSPWRCQSSAATGI